MHRTNKARFMSGCYLALLTERKRVASRGDENTGCRRLYPHGAVVARRHDCGVRARRSATGCAPETNGVYQHRPLNDPLDRLPLLQSGMLTACPTKRRSLPYSVFRMWARPWSLSLHLAENCPQYTNNQRHYDKNDPKMFDDPASNVLGIC